MPIGQQIKRKTPTEERLDGHIRIKADGLEHRDESLLTFFGFLSIEAFEAFFSILEKFKLLKMFETLKPFCLVNRCFSDIDGEKPFTQDSQRFGLTQQCSFGKTFAVISMLNRSAESFSASYFFTLLL
jgi:hypothetical protein